MTPAERGAAERGELDVMVILNGSPRTLRAAPATSLLRALRGAGHTGTTGACEQGECGSCSVRLDGELVCSCLVPAAACAGREVATIEGGVAPDLAAALARHGAVQCGFCTPGVVLAAEHVLARSAAAAPLTRPAVTEGLAGNLCRCTGYQGIVEAVLDVDRRRRTAAGEGVGEAAEEAVGEAAGEGDEGASPRVGASVARHDVPAKIDGSFTFSNDLAAPGMLFGATVRSPHAHARVVSIDAGALDGDPDVIALLTAADVPGSATVGHIVADQPVFASDVVRFHGEPVAFVVATSQEAARRAAGAVRVGYEPLPPLDDPERALDADAPVLHPDGNLFRRVHLRRGELPPRAEVEVEATFHTGRQDQAFLGVESALAVPDPDGGVTLRLATQDLAADQHQTATALGLPLELVRLEMSGAGGAFGGREDMTCQVHLALAALRTGRPVKTTYLRSESFLAHPKRHPARLRYRIGADRDGTLRFVEARIRLDGGPYASTSGPVAASAAYFAAGPYRVPAVDVVAESVRTNNPLCGAMRGFGAVQACFGIESAMDLLAAELGMDPVELRRRNALVPGDEFPTSGQRVGPSAPVLELIDRCLALPLPGAPAPAGGVRRGVGFALGVKNHMYPFGIPESASATVHLSDEGVEVRSAATEVGQGIGSALAQIAAHELGLGPVAVAAAHSRFGYAGSSSASRATFLSGGATRLAALDAAARLRARVAERWSVAPGDVTFTDGAVVVRGERLPLAVALGGEPITATATFHAPATEPGDEHGQGDVHIGWMFVAHRAVVDVDVDLGLAQVVQLATAQDVGRQVNPREVRGQIIGGTSQGLGLALLESLDTERGIVRNATFTDYLIPTAADMPPMEVAVVEHADPDGPYGLKGVGEPPSLSSTPAIAAAMRAATGRPLTRVPVRPEDIAL